MICGILFRRWLVGLNEGISGSLQISDFKGDSNASIVTE